MIPTTQQPSAVQVLLTEEISAGQGHEVWRAVVLQMPHIVAEGQDREEVISAIKKMLSESVRHTEIITLSLPDLEQIEDPLAAAGYRHYGIFADDPEALELFDEIEEERNKRFIEPVQP
jgi:hypothetical protein